MLQVRHAGIERLASFQELDGFRQRMDWIGVHSFNAVSYTHLDVYKRQVGGSRTDRRKEILPAHGLTRADR